MSRQTDHAPLRETDLFAPIERHLAANGYTVRAEVKHCDIAARKGDDLILIELKLRFGSDLLVQATTRQRICDSVYVALPRPDCGGWSKRWRGIRHLLRRLELGLLFVTLGQAESVEVVFHPGPFQRQKRKKAKRAVLVEMAGRSDNFNTGGSSATRLVTAYREIAIRIACCLNQFGPLQPKALRALGTGPKTQSILSSNFYGWFERIDRGVYGITAEGRSALENYPAIVERCLAETKPALAQP